MARRLPSLNALRTFEAAARLGSFTDAARELYVTQGAVSRGVAGLEAWFGAGPRPEPDALLLLNSPISVSFR